MVMFLLFIIGLQEKINGTQTVSLNVQTWNYTIFLMPKNPAEFR
jgi:hypothetical protein